MESIAGEQYKIQYKLQVTIPWYCNTICKVMTNQFGKYSMQEGSIRYSTSYDGIAILPGILSDKPVWKV